MQDQCLPLCKFNELWPRCSYLMTRLVWPQIEKEILSCFSIKFNSSAELKRIIILFQITFSLSAWNQRVDWVGREGVWLCTEIDASKCVTGQVMKTYRNENISICSALAVRWQRDRQCPVWERQQCKNSNSGNNYLLWPNLRWAAECRDWVMDREWVK